MLEPIWLSATCAQPLVLDAAHARAVWRALGPAANSPAGLDEAADTALIRARAQQLLELALRCSEGSGEADPAAPVSVHDGAPELRAAIRTWHLHRRARGLPTGAAHISAAARQQIRLALRSGWPGSPSAATAALPRISPGPATPTGPAGTGAGAG